MGREDNVGESAASLKMKPGDTIGAQGGDDQGEQRGAEGNDDAVLEPGGKAEGTGGGEHGLVAVECGRFGEKGGRGIHFAGGFERDGDHPDKGENGKEADQHCDHDDSDLQSK